MAGKPQTQVEHVWFPTKPPPLGMGCCLLLGLFQNGPSTDRASNVTVEVGDNYFQWLDSSLTSDMSHPLAQSGSKPHRSVTREQDAFALWTFLPNQKILRTDEKLCIACSFSSFVAPESVHCFCLWKGWRACGHRAQQSCGATLYTRNQQSLSSPLPPTPTQTTAPLSERSSISGSKAMGLPFNSRSAKLDATTFQNGKMTHNSTLPGHWKSHEHADVLALCEERPPWAAVWDPGAQLLSLLSVSVQHSLCMDSLCI